MKLNHLKHLLPLIPLALLLFACTPEESGPQQQNQPERQAEQSNDQQPAKAGETQAGHDDHDHDHEKCGSGAEPPSEDDGPLLSKRAVGAPVLDSVELVSAADIVNDPDQYSGRTVRIQGSVKGFCHHRRAWFALDVPTATPPYIRVITAPGFLVPGNIMNAQATTVGTVEVTEVPGSRLSHYEREHKLGSGGNEPGRARRVIIRATGAVFAPPASS